MNRDLTKCIEAGNGWTDHDIDVAYLMGVINGASHEATGRTRWPSLDRVQQELERIKADGIDIRAAVRALKAPASAIAVESPQPEGRGFGTESAARRETPKDYEAILDLANEDMELGLSRSVIKHIVRILNEHSPKEQGEELDPGVSEEPVAWMSTGRTGGFMNPQDKRWHELSEDKYLKKIAELHTIPLYARPVLDQIMEVAEPYLTIEECADLRTRLSKLITK